MLVAERKGPLAILSQHATPFDASDEKGARHWRAPREEPSKYASGYFWMQVSAVSLVHSSRPVNTGSSTFSPLIKLIMTVGAL